MGSRTKRSKWTTINHFSPIGYLLERPMHRSLVDILNTHIQPVMVEYYDETKKNT